MPIKKILRLNWIIGIALFGDDWFEKLKTTYTPKISYPYFVLFRDLCINMNNHQNAIFHQITNFLKTPLALPGVDLKNFQFNKICHFANHPYLCKGLI